MFIRLVVGLDNFWGLRLIKVLGSLVHKKLGPYVHIFFVLHKTFGALCSRAQGPLLLMKSGKSSKMKNKNTKTLERT